MPITRAYTPLLASANGPGDTTRAMDKFDRIFQLHAILASRRTPIPLADLMARLECSKSTLLRAINTLKNQLNAPVVFDAAAGGYKYGNPEGAGVRAAGVVVHRRTSSRRSRSCSAC